MSKAFFDELHITALMAAPSVGRRSWYHSPSDIKKSGGLDCSKPPLVVWACQRAAVRRLFSFAVVRQIKILNYNSLMVAVIGMLQMRFAGAKGARREVNTSNTSIFPIDVKGICHAVPQ